MNSTTANPFKLFGDQTPLSGRCLIEASAGTGKTYNLSGLFVRLVAENKFECAEDPSRIVVVTYTRAATKELRERITERLRGARDILDPLKDRGAGKDNFLEEFKKHYRKDGDALAHLNQAVGHIDELSVFTIHGFAHRLLMEFGPYANIDYTGEIVTDAREFTSELIYDYWRDLLSRSEEDLTSYALLQTLQDHSSTPEEFIKAYSGLMTDNAIRYDRCLSFEELRKTIEKADKAFSELKADFDQETIGEFKQLFYRNEPDNLNLYVNPFKPEKWDTYESALNDIYRAPNVVDPGWSTWKSLEYLGTDAIHDKIKKAGTFEDLPLSNSTHRVMQCIADIRDHLSPFWEETGYILQGVLRDLNEAYYDQLNERDEYSYDDLLYMADQMMGHQKVNKMVRERYPISLIDEFQDTDPLQWSLFDQLYPSSESDNTYLCLIGDPKQSIYRFRGADVQAYLRARASIKKENHFTLQTNWRSDEPVLESLNHLWGKHDNPFHDPGIEYRKVHFPPEKDPDEPKIKDQPALEWIVDDRESADLNKHQASDRAATIAAQHIVKTLEKTGPSNSSVGPGDIAVLCGTNDEAALMKQKLFERGYNSVQLSRDNVYASSEARELQLIMEAAAEPSNITRLRAAMGTQMLDACELLAKLSNEEEPDAEVERQWEAWLESVHEWHRRWIEDGVVAMLRQILEQEKCVVNLLRYHDGERRVTNLRHLVELIQEFARERPGEIQYQLHELQRRRKEAGDRSVSEEEELRLESDRDLINIVTVHRSKGLEYPMVYTPFLWNGISASGLSKRRPFVYHASDPAFEGQLLIDVDGDQYPDSRYHYFCEEFQDKLRTAYVALTRAAHHNVIIHVPYNKNYRDKGKSAYAPIDYVLFGSQRYKQALKKKFGRQVNAEEKWISYSELIDTIAERADASPSITLTCWKEDESPQKTEKSDDAEQVQRLLERRSFDAHEQLHPAWILQSYSALRRGAHTSADLTLEMYDVQMDDPEDAIEEKAVRTDEPSMFTFPKGARTGLCWHHIYEEIDFGADESYEYEEKIRGQLESHGFDAGRWTSTLLEHVQTTLQKPLNESGDLRLGELDGRKVNKEMEFYFGYDQADIRELQQVIRPSSPLPPTQPLTPGLMNGFIDLTFQYNGKVFLLDYKSNHLGMSFDDYRPEALRESILEHYYDLQYHLYALALHRYLRQRIGSDYDYDTHFGGAYYLYLRGIREEGWTGVFYDRPDRGVIEALDQYFKGGRT